MFNILLLLLSHTINCKSDNEEIIDYGLVNIANQLVLINMIKGDLQATNSTYFELKWKGRMRIILESIWGDADLYLSYKSKNPGSEVDNHDVLSTTCGLDIIDVPQFAQRPLYLAVSGHPFSKNISYRMVWLMLPEINNEFEEPIDIPSEIIYSLPQVETVSNSLISLVEFILDIFIEVLL
ncbi:unnamed protein product [Dracunculus medinensis]|uniref:Uncharacterized protein n=1 Tax=Dracunculus medinensis TaxID=318479 RepID=A0A0N4UIB9_DRAME|nr:unnamed protein product [Dracunculus medinensis]